MRERGKTHPHTHSDSINGLAAFRGKQMSKTECTRKTALKQQKIKLAKQNLTG